MRAVSVVKKILKNSQMRSVFFVVYLLGMGSGAVIGFYYYRYFLCERTSHLSEKDNLHYNIPKEIEDESKQPHDKECDFYVDIAGAVGSPGVYCMQDGQILNDAVLKAGGLNTRVYAMKFVMQRLNLARTLEREEKIYIPFGDDVECKLKSFKEDPSGVNDPVVTKEALLQDGSLEEAICVSINNASLKELMELSGVGESTGQKIIDGRPYEKLQDLMGVSGIGEKTFDKLEGDICL